MPENEDLLSTPQHTPWNKGKLTGTKPPLRPKHVSSIRTKHQGRFLSVAAPGFQFLSSQQL
jgi:hypothetical protein